MATAYLSTLAASDPRFRAIAREELEDSIEWLRTRHEAPILRLKARALAILKVLEGSVNVVLYHCCKDILTEMQVKKRAWRDALDGVRRDHEETWGPLIAEQWNLFAQAMEEAGRIELVFVGWVRFCVNRYV